MSMSGALSNALSGLTVASRAAELVSHNISNALTEGYGKRELSVSARLSGSHGGVVVDGISRLTDKRLVADRREAQAAEGESKLSLAFLQRLERTAGTPDNPASLTGRLAAFETALISAVARPEAIDRLNIVAARAGDVASAISRTGREIQTMRAEADRDIAQQVSTVNASLDEVSKLNVRISAALNQGADATVLEDHRQVLIDRISAIIPIREVSRERGTVALFTEGGAILLDGKPGQLSFNPVHDVQPHMTIENGLLSGVALNGVPLTIENQQRAFAGGTLAGLFATRDTLAPQIQADLDALTRDLVTRFEDPATDPTLAGAAGLFTDNGVPFSSAQEVGLSLRLKVNARIVPSEGGLVTRLRDGIGSSGAGPIGASEGLAAMIDALQRTQSPASGNFGVSARSAPKLASDFLSSIGNRRDLAEQSQSYQSARLSETKAAELADGVDTDQEMQRLLLIEKAYAANARMIQVVDDMLQTLLRL